MNTNSTKTSKKLDETDCALLGLSTVYPDDSLAQTSDKLSKIKPLERTSIYRRLTKSQQLKENIDLVRQNNSEYLTRELVSPTLRQTKKLIKSKELDPKLKFSYHKLILDKEYGTDDTKRPTQPVQVNIGQIQALITQSIKLDSDTDDRID